MVKLMAKLMSRLVPKLISKLRLSYLSGFFIALILQLSVGCASNNSTESSTKSITTNVAESLKSAGNKKLYYAIGGQAGIEDLVNAFVKRIAQDQIILPYFAKSSVKHFKQGFINHLCAMVNGPCKYTGDTMIDIHTGMYINEGDFNRVVELLIQAMEDVGISYRSQNKILAKLAPLRGQVIKM